MNTEFVYEMKHPTKGIKTLTFSAPKFGKSGAFCAKFRNVFAEVITKMRNDTKTEKTDGGSESAIGTHEALYLLSLHPSLFDLQQSFVDMCTNSDMCKSEGAKVNAAMWSDFHQEDLEGAFGGYCANFTITSFMGNSAVKSQ